MEGMSIHLEPGGQVLVHKVLVQGEKSQDGSISAMDVDDDRRVDLFMVREKGGVCKIHEVGRSSRKEAKRFSEDARDYLDCRTVQQGERRARPARAKKAQAALDQGKARAKRLYRDFVKALKEKKVAVKAGKEGVSYFEFKTSDGYMVGGQVGADEKGKIERFMFGSSRKGVLLNVTDAKYIRPIQAELDALYRKQEEKDRRHR